MPSVSVSTFVIEFDECEKFSFPSR
jgi:hypothetical protein